MIFPNKTVVLAANVQSTLVWSGSDFQKSLGYARPEEPISMTFSVNNQTSQVCYVAISFETELVTYNINDRRSIAGIPAQSTIRISSNLAAELAALGPNLISVTLYLLSAAAGTITVTAEGFDRSTSPGSVSGGGENIGLDRRAVLDYISVRLALGVVLTGGQAFTSTYTVPSGKRAEILSFSGSMDATPFGNRDCFVSLSSTGLGSANYTFYSKMFERVEFSLTGIVASVEAGNSVDLTIENDNPSAAVTKLVEGLVLIREYFS